MPPGGFVCILVAMRRLLLASLLGVMTVGLAAAPPQPAQKRVDAPNLAPYVPTPQDLSLIHI